MKPAHDIPAVSPPRLARRLLSLVLPVSEREFFLGDLNEEFQERIQSGGVYQARRWYWRQALEAPGWWHRTSPDFGPDYAEVGKGEIMLSIVQDFRYAFRSLVKSPSLVVLALTALALGIGANTAVFSVVNGVLLNPLPYAEPDRLVRLWESPPPNFPTLSVAPANFLDWEKQNTVFAGLGAYREDGFNFSGDGVPERINGARMTAGLATLLGVTPEIGRWFSKDEDRPGADRVVMLGHDLWQRKFGGDRSIIGKDIRIEGVPRTVLGIMPRGFSVPIEGAEFWIPFSIDQKEVQTGANSLRVLGRLKPESTIEQARTQLNRITERIQEQRAQPIKGLRVTIGRMDESIFGEVSKSLWIMLGSVALVLLIACANVANLLLARGVLRRKEIALRFSLGASRARLLGQLLMESLILSLAGGLLGIGLAAAGLNFLKAEAPANIPRLAGVSIDLQVLGFTIVISIATGLLFGLTPAIRGSRLNLSESIKSASHGSTTGRRDYRAARLLVVVQVMIAMIVIISSGLMLRTLWNLYAADPGFRTEERLTFQINLSPEKYARPQARSAFIFGIIERIRNLPGVRNVAATHRLPMTGQSGFGRVIIEGKPEPAPGENVIVIYRSITPEYFDVLDMPLLRGRTFSWNETRESGGAVVINQRMASRFWPGEDALGRRIRTPLRDSWLTVVGIVSDSKEVGLTVDGLIGMYLPYSIVPNLAMNIVVHTAADDTSVTSAIRQEIQKLDADVAVAGIKPLNDVVAASIGARSFAGALLTIFAGLALLLAAAGIYGVLAYAVNQRIREIGVRMALGANRRTVLKQIITDGLYLILPGVAAGAAGAWGATRLLNSLLFEVNATDPATFAAISVFVILIGGLACYIPARKAASVDPLVALRID